MHRAQNAQRFLKCRDEQRRQDVLTLSQVVSPSGVRRELSSCRQLTHYSYDFCKADRWRDGCTVVCALPRNTRRPYSRAPKPTVAFELRGMRDAAPSEADVWIRNIL